SAVRAAWRKPRGTYRQSPGASSASTSAASVGDSAPGGSFFWWARGNGTAASHTCQSLRPWTWRTNTSWVSWWTPRPREAGGGRAAWTWAGGGRDSCRWAGGQARGGP